MSTTSAYRAGLQSLALALIFMPEPVTTVVGLGLLSIARYVEKERPNNFRQLPKTLDEHFDYRIVLKGGSLLTVETAPRKHGQLPRVYPRAAGLQDNPEVFKAVRESLLSAQQKKSIRTYPRLPALLKENPEAFRALQQRSSLQQRKSAAVFSNTEPAGLLKPSVARRALYYSSPERAIHTVSRRPQRL